MRCVADMRMVMLAALFSVALCISATEIERGKFLVANEGLSDPNFDSTVVLIIGHSNMGTLGLIINRPFNDNTTVKVPEKYAQLLANTPQQFGGPVPVDGLRALVDSDFTLPNSIHVKDSLFFLDNPAAFDYLLEETEAMGNARLYHGISSWIPGQLDAEIRAGAWYVIPGDLNLVFTDTNGLWERLVTQIHAKWVNIPQLPQNVLPPTRRISIMPALPHLMKHHDWVLPAQNLN